LQNITHELESRRPGPDWILGESTWDLWWSVAVVQVFSRLLTFSLISVIPPLLHSYSLIYYLCCIIPWT